MQKREHIKYEKEKPERLICLCPIRESKNILCTLEFIKSRVVY